MAQQLELIPLTTDQKHAAGLLVAKLTLDLGALQAQHAEIRASMKALERALVDRLTRLATAIRDGREPGVEDL